MVFTPGGEICAMSMLMANMSCLALSSYFSTILPTKRSLLTRFNTVFVLAMTAWVNALVRMSVNWTIYPFFAPLAFAFSYTSIDDSKFSAPAS